MVKINGLNNLQASGGPDKSENNAQSASRFDSNAQVSSPKDGSAARMKIQLTQTSSSAGVDNQDHTIELEVATLGNIRITSEQLKGFEARVAEGLKRQEKQIMSAVNIFGADNLLLKDAIYSALAA
jgi:hypothetical protein